DELLAGTDACYAPVLDLEEAAAHPHNVARGVHIEVDGIVQPAPVPRFSVTPPDTPTPSVSAGAHTRAVLEGFGFADDEVADLLARGIVTQD
ncbi:MAG: CoA transferase, partial [Actinomycetota bacterium]